MTWIILKVAPQREAVVARDLRDQGFDAYFPRETVKVTLRGKAFERRRPLMPGYLFAEASWSEDIADTRHVHDCLRIGEVPAHLNRAEVNRIKAMELEFAAAMADSRVRFRAGDRVKVGGPFGSIEALIRSVRGSRAVVDTPMLGGSTRTTVPLDYLERIPP